MLILNQNLNKKAHNSLQKKDKEKIGVVNEALPVIDELNGMEYLSFLGSMYKIPKIQLKSRIESIFNFFFDDKTDLKKNILHYSSGMKSKIAFCAAVIHTPDILILDEPFSGLDPISANQMVSFLQQYKKEHRLILISSHNLHYVEKIATHIGILDKEKLVINSTIGDFTNSGVNTLDTALLEILKTKNIETNNLDWI